MKSTSPGINPVWIIVAFPAGLLVLLAIVLVIALSARPAKDASGPKVARSTPVAARPSSPEPSTPAAAETPPQSSAVVEPTPAPALTATPPTDAAAAPSPAAAVALAPTAATPSTPTAAPAGGTAIDLLATIDLDASAVSGAWRKEGNAIRCTNASAQSRAKLRLVPPPPGDGYDLAITFTARGQKRFVAPILSFRGRQFIFGLNPSQSGFASVRGQNAFANETTRPKGIKASTKYALVIKVRDKEVSAYIDGELVTSHATDYSDLDVSNAWNLGSSASRENVLGLAVECPILVEAISLTPLQDLPATKPAPSGYKDLAAMISSPYSTESSSAATQPAAKREIRSGDLQSLVATSQPVISDVAAQLLLPPGAATTQPGLDAGTQENLYRAVQLAMASATQLPDPLLDSRPSDPSPVVIDRAEFDAEQRRLGAWRTLVGRIDSFYPAAKPQRDVVKLRLTRESSEGGKTKPASLVATNGHSEPLTNVTLVIEMVHAMTSPSPTSVHHYYLPRWSAGQKIFLPAACVPNVASRELLESAGPPAVAGLGGLIEARVQVWSDKVAQANQAISFDNNFQAIARAELDEAYRVIDESLRRPPAASRPATGAAQPQQRPAPRPAVALVAGPIVPPRSELEDDVAELAIARAAARRARSVIPPQSSLADEAQDLMTQPLAALRELRKRQVDAYVAAMPVRGPRAGVWVVQQPGMLGKLAKPGERDAAVGAAGNNGGRFTLTIESRTNDGGSVAAVLASADQPDMKRRFTGRLQLDTSANRLLLNLRATQPPPTKAPAEGDLKRVVYWNSLLLELRGNALIGIGSAGPLNDATILNVAFGAPAAPPADPSRPPARK